MGHVSMPKTTHTVELTQLADLNSRLSEQRPEITAGGLRLSGVPKAALLTRLCWDGPPDFPYVHAHFTLADDDNTGSAKKPAQPNDWIVDLHTAALQELSHRLGARQQWGTG